MKNSSLLRQIPLLILAFSFFSGTLAQVSPGDLVITEIMNNPSVVSDGSGEWFEVYNTTDSPINMNGMVIKDNDIDLHTIASSLVVPAFGYAVLGNNGDMATNGGLVVDYVYGSSWFLANAGDEVIIQTADGTVIDQVEYDGGPVFPDPTGASMSLDPNHLNSTDNDFGENWCESYYVFGAGDKGTPGSTNLPCSINPGDLVITEIMNNPSVVYDYQGEWFEVYNTTDLPIIMTGMIIKDNDIDLHTIASSLVVPAMGYAVLGNNGDMATNGGVVVDYVYGDNWFLANAGDEVIIQAADGTVIDQVEYDGGPVFPDPTGASMSLDPYHLNSTDNDFGENWCESYYVFGAGDMGTPGAENLPCIFNNPPVAACQDVTAPADENCEAYVSAEEVDNGSYDPDGDPVIIEVLPEGPYPVGTTEVVLTITDDSGESDQCYATITVTDDTEPAITVVADPIKLWPPNHKYHVILLDQLFLDVSDNCGEPDIENVYIAGVTSDEEENIPGDADGNTLLDIVIGEDCKSVQLRSERDEDANGRVYTIQVSADDMYGNTGTAFCQVYVPIGTTDMAIDDGVMYGENCSKSAPVMALDVSEPRLVNQPNPFHQRSTLSFSVAETGFVSLNIYNATGGMVAGLYAGSAMAGQQYQVEFDGSNLPEGIYFGRLQTSRGELVTVKMILMK